MCRKGRPQCGSAWRTSASSHGQHPSFSSAVIKLLKSHHGVAGPPHLALYRAASLELTVQRELLKAGASLLPPVLRYSHHHHAGSHGAEGAAEGRCFATATCASLTAIIMLERLLPVRDPGSGLQGPSAGRSCGAQRGHPRAGVRGRNSSVTSASLRCAGSATCGTQHPAVRRQDLKGRGVVNWRLA